MKQLFVFIFFISSFISWSQKEGQWEKKGEQAMEQGDFIAAAEYYLTAYQLNEDNLMHYYHYGEALKKENLFDNHFRKS